MTFICKEELEAMHVADKFEEGYKAGVYDTKTKSWKPSEEQMAALKKAQYMMSQSGDYYDTTAIINSLITDLQKLL